MTAGIPLWFHWLSIASLGVALVCAAAIALDEMRRPQHMAIMNLVWPLTALFGSVAAFWGYRRYGLLSTHQAMEVAKHRKDVPARERQPFAASVGLATSHCGSGCTLGDLIAESLALIFPSIAVWFGWHTLFAEKMFAVWVLDFILAFGFGIAFQYFTIAPMQGLGLRDGLIAAIKADTLSLTAWQVGMYGMMALAQLWLFRRIFGVAVDASMPEFWFAMQLAMIAGFVTAYPVNWWLVRAGIKEKM
jgi:hypothetical protein